MPQNSLEPWYSRHFGAIVLLAVIVVMPAALLVITDPTVQPALDKIVSASVGVALIVLFAVIPILFLISLLAKR